MYLREIILGKELAIVGSECDLNYELRERYLSLENIMVLRNV